jgi:hypothetical protein
MVDPIRPVPPRRVCPPGTIQIPVPPQVSGKPRVIVPPRVVCVRPGFVTPFGGPSSGISPAGGLPAAAEAAPGVIVTPPTPVPSCVTASIFADCFGLCTGVINGVTPGPVCGWTFIEPFGALGGQFTFSPGVMLMETFDADDFPIAAKPLASPLATVFGVSGQFTFTEHQTPPNPNTTYQLIVNNTDLSESLLVSLFGDGSLIVQAGDPAAIPTYSTSMVVDSQPFILTVFFKSFPSWETLGLSRPYTPLTMLPMAADPEIPPRIRLLS